jgi:hypothetical protein
MPDPANLVARARPPRPAHFFGQIVPRAFGWLPLTLTGFVQLACVGGPPELGRVDAAPSGSARTNPVPTFATASTALDGSTPFDANPVPKIGGDGGARPQPSAAPTEASGPTSAVPSAAPAVPDVPGDERWQPFRKDEWETAIGEFAFADDGSVTCACKATSSLLYWKRERPRDLDFEVELEFLGPESSLGILFREVGEDFYQDATFYQFEWYTRGSHHDRRLSLMRKNPYWVQIVTPKEPVAAYHVPISLRIVADGRHLRAYRDGAVEFELDDATFVRAGRIGLHMFQPRPVRLLHFRSRKPTSG